MIEALDYFVQKAAHNEALSNRDGDTAGAQIEKLVFINLAGSRSVGATDVVGENFQAGHRVHFCVVTQQKVTNFLIRGHEALPGSVAENGAAAIVECVFVQEIARSMR
jgi:hypothetical protein